jgi:hypothetical protein
MTLILATLLALQPQEKLELNERWFYFPFDLREEKHVLKFQELAARAAKVGYNGVLLEDPCFGKLPLMEPGYFEHLERVKASAAANGLAIIPALFQIGHSENVLAQDPNLAVGLPVKDALFVVRNGALELRPDPEIRLSPRPDWKDDLVSDDLIVGNPDGRFARATWNVDVKPFRQYRVTARLRTHGFKGLPRIVVTGGGRMLNYDLPKVLPTQDWTEIDAVFNPLDASRVRIQLGCWDGGQGVFQWSAPRVEEIAFLNVVRRPGAPLTARAVTGGPLFEGTHFERVVDPLLGKAPKIGGFSEWHALPRIKSTLPNGTLLRISYHHALTFPDAGQMMMCFHEPKAREILKDQARRLHAIFKAKAYFMSFDEIRVLNWDESCRAKNLDAGGLVAEAAKELTAFLKELNPGGGIYAWNDMFDPFHNARDRYCLVRGNLAGSWEGLDRDVVVANWYFDRRDENLAFFSERGHRTLIAGYYDKLPERANDWLDSAAKSKGVVGIMYTSWYDRFADLETWADHVNRRRR